MHSTITRISVLFFFLFSLSLTGFSQDEGTAEATEAADAAPSAVSLYNEGLTKLKAKEYDAALPLLVDAIAAADTTSETDLKVIGLAKRNGAIAAYYLGTSQRKADQLEEAVETYQLGIDYNPGFYANHIGYAQALDAKGDKVKAVGAYMSAAEVCNKSEKTKDKAESMETKAINTVIRLFLDKKTDETLEAAELFLAIKESPDVLTYKAKALAAKGDNESALAAAEKAAGMADQAANKDLIFFTKGEIHQALGQNSDAISSFKMAGGKYADAAKYKITELEK
jgi:tetratricopeptide (TPR) repeat protein